MRKIINKLLVLFTFSVFVTAATVIFWIDIVHSKKINIENGLSFGNKNSSIKLVVFEDFKCDHCKEFSQKFLPQIKEKYIDTNKISYILIPLAFIEGSKPIANAAIIIYEMNKNRFFDFVKMITDENIKIETKEDLVEIAKKIEGINIEIFKEFLNKEIFNEYLLDNLDQAKRLFKPFKVPNIYINGISIKADQVNSKIDELISYKEKNETVFK